MMKSFPLPLAFPAAPGTQKHPWRFASALLLLICLMNIVPSAQAQIKDSKGTDFWLSFNENEGTPNLYLYITGEQAATGTVAIPGLAFTQNFTTTPGAITTITLPSSAALASSGIVENKGIHVTADKEVTVYGMNLRQFTTDAYLGLPTDALGLEYFIMSYQGAASPLDSQIGIVATENATTVSFTLKAGSGSYLANTPYNIALNQGQTFYLRSDADQDFTGSVITSNKPVAVFSGTRCANVPHNAAACDHLVEQMPPTDGLGKNFISFPLATRNGDTYRFLASVDNTTITVNGAVETTLNRGQFFEKIYTVPINVVASQPILVAQYSNGITYDNTNGDPFMVLIPPYEQFLGAYTVTTPSSGFANNYVNLLAPNAAVGTIQLDGVTIPAASFTAIGATGFSGAAVPLSIGTHNLTGGGLPFGVTVYGFNFADSYGYLGGASFAPIVTVTSIVFSPKTQTETVGTEKCVTALIKDQDGNPVEGVRVDFTITGANPGSSGFANTAANGVATFCYTGANVGTDNIVAAVGTLTDDGSITWNPLCLPITFSTSQTNISCNGGSDGSITVTATGGTPALSYSKDGGVTYSASSTFTGLSAGTYTIQVRDANQCTATAQIVAVNEPTSLPGFTASTANVNCKGGNDGSITVTASGGTAGYTYSKDGGANYGNSSTFAGLSAGNYAIRVKDANGCETATQSVAVTEPASLPGFTTSVSNVKCKGGSDGSIAVTASGGTAGYTYSKDGGANYGNSSTFAGLSAGNYAIRVKDANGCETPTQNVTVNEPTSLPTVTISGNTSVVYTPTAGSNCTTLTANPSGGTGSFTYAWSSGGTGPSEQVCPETTTPYSVTVTDANGCSATAQVTVNVKDVRCGPNKTYVTVCYYGTTQCVREKTAANYLKLGATLGSCNSGGGGPVPSRIGVEEDLTQTPFELSVKGYPNPTQGPLTVEVISRITGPAQMQVLDLTGRAVQQRVEQLLEGRNQVQFDLTAQPSGTYLIRASDGMNRQGVVRISKQ